MSSIWTIRRSATDHKAAGLCGGVAQHWGVDPVLVRVGCVLLALSGGIGLVLYLAGWLLIPVEGSNKAQIDDLLGGQARSWPREAWIAIVAACSIMAFVVLSQLTPFSFWPAVILALVWYFGYYKNGDHRPGRSMPAPPSEVTPPPAAQPPQFFSFSGPTTPFTEAADAWRIRIEQAQQQPFDQAPPTGSAANRGYGATAQPVQEDLSEPTGLAATLSPHHPLGAESAAYQVFLAHPDPVGLYPETPPGPELAASPLVRPADRTSARRLRLISLVVLGLTLTGLGVADQQGVPIPIAAYFASALLVLGLTLVAATWLGRARGILPVALVILLATLGTSAAGPMVQQQVWAPQRVVYTSAAELAAGDTVDGGQFTVDLTKLSTTTDVSYAAHLEVGSLVVVAPTTMNVVVDSQVEAGALLLAGQKSEYGNELKQVVSMTPADPKKPTLTLKLSVEAGVVQVRR